MADNSKHPFGPYAPHKEVEYYSHKTNIFRDKKCLHRLYKRTVSPNSNQSWVRHRNLL